MNHFVFHGQEVGKPRYKFANNLCYNKLKKRKGHRAHGGSFFGFLKRKEDLAGVAFK